MTGTFPDTDRNFEKENDRGGPPEGEVKTTPLAKSRSSPQDAKGTDGKIRRDYLSLS